MYLLNVCSVLPIWVSISNQDYGLTFFLIVTSLFSTLDYIYNRKNILYKWLHYFGVSGIFLWVLLNLRPELCFALAFCSRSIISLLSLFFNEEWLFMFAWRSVVWIMLSVMYKNNLDVS